MENFLDVMRKSCNLSWQPTLAVPVSLDEPRLPLHPSARAQSIQLG